MDESKMSSALVVRADEVPPRQRPSNYPEPFFGRMARREKRPLGDYFGLKNFGVNLTRIAPGGQSALLHRHSRQDEFVYVLEGELILVTDKGEIALSPGMCAGFPAQGCAHQLVNRSDREALYLEVGDRTAGDEGEYPADDIKALMEAPGRWRFVHKDGRPY